MRKRTFTTKFTRFTGTKVQILTHKALQVMNKRTVKKPYLLLYYLDRCSVYLLY
jgi:hypothetical protein